MAVTLTCRVAMASRLAGCRLILCLSLAIITLSLGSLPLPGSAMGLPKPRTNLTLTIGVEGVVWCAKCRRAGGAKSLEASPLPNAAALLRCRRGGWALSVRGATDASGYFLLQTGKQVAAFTSKDCEVDVTESPARPCGGGGVAPAGERKRASSPLKFRRFVTLPNGMQALYTAGNITFGVQDPSKC